jgi:deazaflavin-dependent oxidoreductase (nitroreductase family)
MTTYNEQMIAEFRANEGNVTSGPFVGKELLLLHTIGKSSGKERVTPTGYVLSDGCYVIMGTNAGGPEPLWFGNLKPMTEVTIEVGPRTVRTKPEILLEGPEYDKLYAQLLDFWPILAEYRAKTTRVFPIVRLRPLD